MIIINEKTERVDAWAELSTPEAPDPTDDWYEERLDRLEKQHEATRKKYALDRAYFFAIPREQGKDAVREQARAELCKFLNSKGLLASPADTNDIEVWAIDPATRVELVYIVDAL